MTAKASDAALVDGNYRMRLVDDLATIGQEAWDALAFPDPDGVPFLRYAFLAALHETGCAAPQSGWQPRFLTLWRDARLVAACPLYAKGHSYGEYVFDWAWADAYARHGLEYYPKLCAAIPFTPVVGPRLLACDAESRAALVKALLDVARASAVSSLHVLFPAPEEAELLARAGMLMREGVQFHWHNEGYADFEAFLESLNRKKRKNIRAERRHVAEAGVVVTRVAGADASRADWRHFFRCYENTYRAHYSTPYLNLAFFERIGRDMPENLVLVIAQRHGKPIAAALVVTTPSTLYGRYWGETEHVPNLHFECAYYQPLEYCIENRLSYFEGGAQGEHKMARGFLPVRTHSAHWLAHPAFAEAVAEFLARETSGMARYMDELNERNPFKSEPAAP